MHDIVIEEFERHLSGEASPAFYFHLESCGGCREQVRALEGVCSAVRELKAPDGEPATPSAGFYNKVTFKIVASQKQTAWGLFSPGAVFFRRVAFASLLLLASLGSFLVSRESGADETDAATIMASHDTTVAHAESSDRDRLLVTLASYRQ